ncbi:MAG TPA: c-type cytochrome [Vicinamibacterales bacterium]|nr:c-type cytochrome [Vicinamibacterales bacterium]
MVRTFIGVSLALALPVLAAAQDTPKIKLGTAPRTDATDGAQMYQSYCAACHGKDGKGNGPAAVALKTKPADLTQLTKTHPGGLSMKDFEDRVNGTAMPISHGTSPMPVWGPVMKSFGNDQLRVYNLKKYIDSLQVAQ